MASNCLVCNSTTNGCVCAFIRDEIPGDLKSLCLYCEHPKGSHLNNYNNNNTSSNNTPASTVVEDSEPKCSRQIKCPDFEEIECIFGTKCIKMKLTYLQETDTFTSFPEFINKNSNFCPFASNYKVETSTVNGKITHTISDHFNEPVSSSTTLENHLLLDAKDCCALWFEYPKSITMEYLCTRCGRGNHKVEDCYAKYHVNGQMLPEICTRCGRDNHSVENCYAGYHANGNLLPATQRCYRCSRVTHYSSSCNYSVDVYGNNL